MADDALDGFAALLEKVPIWSKEIENIMSICSAPSIPLDAIDTHSQDGERFPSPLEALFYRRRIKRSISLYSGTLPAAMPFSSDPRTLVAISYNGDVQQRFDALVRAIGSVRNSLRRGKMSVKVNFLPYIGGAGSDDSGSDPEDTGIMIPLRTRHGFGIGSSDDTRAFDEVDASLGKAQTLCERAAHQALRGGECETELGGARDHFVGAGKRTEQELPRLRERLQSQADQQKRRDERRRNREKRPADEEPTATATVAGPPITPASILEIDVDANLEDPAVSTPPLLAPRSFHLHTKLKAPETYQSVFADSNG